MPWHVQLGHSLFVFVSEQANISLKLLEVRLELSCVFIWCLSYRLWNSGPSTSRPYSNYTVVVWYLTPKRTTIAITLIVGTIQSNRMYNCDHATSSRATLTLGVAVIFITLHWHLSLEWRPLWWIAIIKRLREIMHLITECLVEYMHKSNADM